MTRTRTRKASRPRSVDISNLNIASLFKAVTLYAPNLDHDFDFIFEISFPWHSGSFKHILFSLAYLLRKFLRSHPRKIVSSKKLSNQTNSIMNNMGFRSRPRRRYRKPIAATFSIPTTALHSLTIPSRPLCSSSSLRRLPFRSLNLGQHTQMAQLRTLSCQEQAPNP